MNLEPGISAWQDHGCPRITFIHSWRGLMRLDSMLSFRMTGGDVHTCLTPKRWLLLTINYVRLFWSTPYVAMERCEHHEHLQHVSWLYVPFQCRSIVVVGLCRCLQLWTPVQWLSDVQLRSCLRGVLPMLPTLAACPSLSVFYFRSLVMECFQMHQLWCHVFRLTNFPFWICLSGTFQFYLHCWPLNRIR